MKKNNIWLFSLFSSVLLCNLTSGQITLGSSKGFMQNLKKTIVSGKNKSIPTVSLKISDNLVVQGAINFQDSKSNTESIIGSIKGHPNSSFSIIATDTQTSGHIILNDIKEAYTYSTNKSGIVEISKVDIHDVLCIDFKRNSDDQDSNLALKNNYKIDPALLKLESFPGAPGCALLDFDGHKLPAGTNWNSGDPINAAPSGLSDANIRIHWEVVAEDYRPYNINITTSEAVFNSYPKNRRMRCVVTPTDTAAPDAGGVAFIGSFSNSDTDVCWTFNVSGKVGGDTSSHEIGHTLGLGHDGTPTSGYYSGISNTPFGPIMGASYSRPVAQWSKGEYKNATNKQDDLTIMAGQKYGLGFRKDEHGNTTATASLISANAAGEIIKQEGIITNEADIDFFSFTTTASGSVKIDAKTVSRNGNLDILLKLYDSTGKEMGSFTNTTPNELNATFTQTLPAGKYFVSVDGTGAGDVLSGGYSAYASIGSYTITGTIEKSILSSEDYELTTSLDVFPVPFKKDFSFSVSDQLSNPKVELYDSLGKVYDIDIEKDFSKNLYNVSTNGLSEGMYFLKIQTDKGYKTAKLIKE